MKYIETIGIRIDPETRHKLHVLATVEKKSEAAILRDLIRKEAAAKTTGAAINEPQPN